MAAPRCLNCDAPLTAGVLFCPRCGQRADTARLTALDIWRDLMHAYVNIERGPIAFARALVTRPGGVARDYVHGKRRRYYGPFATLAVLVGATTVAINLLGYQVLAHDGLDPGPANLLQRHFNVLLLAQLPLLGAACALMFRSARMNLFEHMVLTAYALSVRAVVLGVTVPINLLVSGNTPSPLSVATFWAAWYLYFGWAASQFYDGTRAANWLRGSAAAALAHAAITAILLLGSAGWRYLASR
jgi:hypothetical protein